MTVENTDEPTEARRQVVGVFRVVLTFLGILVLTQSLGSVFVTVAPSAGGRFLWWALGEGAAVIVVAAVIVLGRVGTVRLRICWAAMAGVALCAGIGLASRLARLQ